MKLLNIILSLCFSTVCIHSTNAEIRPSPDLLVQKAYLKSSNAVAGEHFGHGIDLDGDTLAIGAPRIGAVHVFSNSDGIWSQEVSPAPDDVDHKDQFGYSIALDDGTLVVGAPLHVGGGSDFLGSGGVYVFLRTDDGWTQQAYLIAGNAMMGDRFGISVAIDGDTLIVGAPMENGDANSTESNYNKNAGYSGAAYVFTRTDGVWSQQAYMKASNAGSRHRFGTSVALHGDTAVVGAVGASVGGAVYVFIRNDNAWSQQADLKAGNAGHLDEFGNSVALGGDTLVVGAIGEHGDGESTSTNPNRGAPRAGAAYVFTRSQGIWSQEAYLKASNALRDQQFGVSVALSGNSLVVGSNQEVAVADRSPSKRNNNAENTGAAYVFIKSGGLWTQNSYLKASNRGKDDQFGISVAMDENIIVVGASHEGGDQKSTVESPNDNATEAGAVYVYQ